MSVNRIHRKKNNYSTILNEGAHDKTLSWQAKGLLWYLCTKPDGWEVREADLARQTDAGVKAVRSILKQLEAAGYLVRWCTRGDRGLLCWRSEIFESKADAKDWISENIELLKTAIRLSSGTIEAVLTMHPSGVYGEPPAIPPLTVDGLTIDGSTVDAQTIDGEAEVIVNTKEINNGFDQLLIGSNTHFSNAIAPEPETEPEKSERADSIEIPAIEPEVLPPETKQPSESPPLTLFSPVKFAQRTRSDRENENLGGDRFSAAPPLDENWREFYAHSKRPPWRLADGSVHPQMICAYHQTGASPGKGNIFSLPDGTCNEPKVSKILRRLDSAALHSSYSPHDSSTQELQDCWRLACKIATQTTTVPQWTPRSQTNADAIDLALDLLGAT